MVVPRTSTTGARVRESHTALAADTAPAPASLTTHSSGSGSDLTVMGPLTQLVQAEVGAQLVAMAEQLRLKAVQGAGKGSKRQLLPLAGSRKQLLPVPRSARRHNSASLRMAYRRAARVGCRGGRHGHDISGNAGCIAVCPSIPPSVQE